MTPTHDQEGRIDVEPNQQAGRQERDDGPRYDPLIDPEQRERYVSAATERARRIIRGERAGPPLTPPKPDPSRLNLPGVREQVEERERWYDDRIAALRRNVAAAPRSPSGAIMLGTRHRPGHTTARAPRPQAPRARAAHKLQRASRQRPPASEADPPGQPEPGDARRAVAPKPSVALAARLQPPAPALDPPAAQTPADGGVVGSLRSFNWATRDLAPDERGEAFDTLSEDVQAALWARLEAECDARNERDRRGEATHTLVDIPGYGLPDDLARPTPERAAPTPAGAATGRRVRRVRCPFPDHPDRDPSFAIYDDGGYCFGCHRRASTAELAQMGVVA